MEIVWGLQTVLVQVTKALLPQISQIELTESLLGPLAALALSLLVNTLFFTGKILPRNTVAREDYDKVTEGLRTVTTALNELVDTVRFLQKGGGL